MPATIEHESGDVFRVRVSGVLRKGELEKVQAVAAREMQSRDTLRLLFLLEQFNGWERGADWGDLEFYAAHGKKIDRIAIVGEEKWRDEALMFAGAGLRKADVQYFLPHQKDQARAFLTSA
jgi:hypothetical protein